MKKTPIELRNKIVSCLVKVNAKSAAKMCGVNVQKVYNIWNEISRYYELKKS